MDYISQWTIYICLTIIIATIFSILLPKGNMGKFYKLIISLFVFISFLIPLSQGSFKSMDFSNLFDDSIVNNSTNSITDSAIESEIKDVLRDNGIENSSVTCSSSVNQDNEIVIEKITVAVSDEYELESVKNIIFDNLSLNVKVIHIGE